jgi:hypothetical protein
VNCRTSYSASRRIKCGLLSLGDVSVWWKDWKLWYSGYPGWLFILRLAVPPPFLTCSCSSSRPTLIQQRLWLCYGDGSEMVKIGARSLLYFSDSGRLTLSRRHPIFCDVCFAAVLVCVSRQLIAGSIRVWYYPTWPTSQQWGNARSSPRERPTRPRSVITLKNWDKYHTRLFR